MANNDSGVKQNTSPRVNSNWASEESMSASRRNICMLSIDNDL